jgi:uncharacterized protein Smg (DUF494 family)
MNAESIQERNMYAAQEQGKERIMEIILFLLAEIRADKALMDIDLKPLSVRGFSETEISTAFSWLIDKYALGPVSEDPILLAVPFGKRGALDPSKSANEASFRVYHEAERIVIAPEAQGFLLQMVELGLISDSDMEFLVDRIMLSGIPTATLEDVKMLVSSTVFNFDLPFSPQGRIMLNVTDRVH